MRGRDGDSFRLRVLLALLAAAALSAGVLPPGSLLRLPRGVAGEGAAGRREAARAASLAEWSRLIQVGDQLAREPGSPPPGAGGLTARAAYLLAFHHAQDVADADRMLVAAERVARLGERDLARHLRRVVAETAVSVPPSPPAGRAAEGSEQPKASSAGVDARPDRARHATD